MWPSTSKSPFASIAPVNVDTPATLRLSKFVCPSTSNSTKSPLPTNVVAVTTPAILTLSKLVWPSTSKSPFASILLEKDAEVASIAPLNVVAVTTPAMLTLSNSVCPSTSISPLISAPVATTVPVTVIPIPDVCNFLLPKWYKAQPSL